MKVRLFAAPAGEGVPFAHLVDQGQMDGDGAVRFPIAASVEGLDLFVAPRVNGLLFGPTVSAKVRVPALAPSGGVALPKAGTVLITEIHKDPSAVSDTAGEWIEFYNTTAQPIDIEGWVLSDLGSNATVLENGGAGILVPQRGYAVVARELDPSLNGGVIAQAAYSQFTLSNGDDEVVLSRPNGLLVDEVHYDDISWPDVAGATLQLSNVRLGPLWNDDPINWCAATQPYGSGDLGTPGVRNDDC